MGQLNDSRDTRSEERGAIEAVFFDALGTLVDLEPPWVHLAAEIDADIPAEKLVSAVREEMAYYKEHSHEGRDQASLAELRRRCAEILTEGLGVVVSVEQLVASVRFTAFDDALPALDALRDRGLKLAVVSNWDCSLPQVLEMCGLGGRFDVVVSSAEAGSLKPDEAIFSLALERVGCAASAVLHVGDTAEEDVAGAEAAGIRALLIDREGGGQITSLTEVAEYL